MRRKVKGKHLFVHSTTAYGVGELDISALLTIEADVSIACFTPRSDLRRGESLLYPLNRKVQVWVKKTN
jgi:hypothetical protein